MPSRHRSWTKPPFSPAQGDGSGNDPCLWHYPCHVAVRGIVSLLNDLPECLPEGQIGRLALIDACVEVHACQEVVGLGSRDFPEYLGAGTDLMAGGVEIVTNRLASTPEMTR